MGKFIWILDASSGDALRFKIPDNFPENGDHERLLDKALTAAGRRLKDCDWMIGNVDFYSMEVSDE